MKLKTYLITGMSSLLVIGMSAFADEHSRHCKHHSDKIFEKFDANKDEQVTKEEVKAKKLEYYKKMDSNNDGSVSLDEFSNERLEKFKQRLKNRFEKLDVNQDGNVTEDEFTAKLPLFDRVDTDKDGVITKSETKKE